jgi:hypothetical protein
MLKTTKVKFHTIPMKAFESLSLICRNSLLGRNPFIDDDNRNRTYVVKPQALQTINKFRVPGAMLILNNSTFSLIADGSNDESFTSSNQNGGLDKNTLGKVLRVLTDERRPDGFGRI